MRALRGLSRFLLVCALLVIVGLPAAAAPVATVRVSFLPFQSNGGLFIADHEGYFAQEQINIVWVPFTHGGEFIPVLAQGQLDVGAGGVSAAFFNAVARGLKIRVVADKGHVGGKSSAGSLLVRRDLAATVRSVADLRGRKIAIDGIGSLGHYIVARALAAAAVPVDQVTLLPFSAPTALAALQHGSVDAALLPIPFNTQAVELGIGVKVIDTADIMPGEPQAFIIYGPMLLEQNPALGRRFMVAYLRGVQRYNEGPTARNVAIIAKYIKVEPAIVQKGGWVDIHRDGFVDAPKIRRYQDWLYEIGLVDVRNPIWMVVDTSFREQALAALSIPQVR